MNISDKIIFDDKNRAIWLINENSTNSMKDRKALIQSATFVALVFLVLAVLLTPSLLRILPGIIMLAGLVMMVAKSASRNSVRYKSDSKSPATHESFTYEKFYKWVNKRQKIPPKRDQGEILKLVYQADPEGFAKVLAYVKTEKTASANHFSKEVKAERAHLKKRMKTLLVLCLESYYDEKLHTNTKKITAVETPAKSIARRLDALHTLEDSKADDWDWVEDSKPRKELEQSEAKNTLDKLTETIEQERMMVLKDVQPRLKPHNISRLD